ncbi:MAG: cupin [Hyphomicrobiales bacterium]|nr:cupin domain-containing protein [Hyphomicrobiales bacterium]PCH49573.1 MAG: cupin [Hyphomicrobiales bacterium]
MSTKRNIWKEFDLITEQWSPRVVADANGQSVKLAKIENQLVWHSHEKEDEIFLIMKGSVTIQYRDRDDVVLNEGDIHTVPKGVEHNPLASGECWVMLFEPKETAHTGNVQSDKTRSVEEQRASIDA